MAPSTNNGTPLAQTVAEKIEELRTRRAAQLLGGGADRMEKQRKQGKMTARERVDALVDPGSFQEMYLFAEHRCTNLDMAGKSLPADGVVTGAANVEGRLIHLASQDFTVAGGAAGEVHCDKIVEMMKLSLKTGSPFVFVNDSGGARIQEGIDSLGGYGRVFYHNTMLSGVVPQVSLICGPCAGGAAYSPALTDFIVQTRQAQMFVTGPAVIKQVTGEDVTSDALGGPDMQMNRSGVAHFVAENDEDAMRICRKLLGFLPGNNMEDPPQAEWDGNLDPDPELNAFMPDDGRKSYDMKALIARVVDGGDFLEVQEKFAPNIVVGFARIAGRSIGIVANQPAHKAGTLDIDSSDKGARFVRFCNAFNIPIVTFVDVPGFMPGVNQEQGGIIRHGAKMLFAYAAATVPKITVVVRKAYGGAYLAMCSKDMGADRVLAWPTAEIAVMGAEGAVAVVYKKEIDAATDKKARRNELIEEYRRHFASPYVAASRRLVDDIVEPAETRRQLANALEALHTKRDIRPAKKHGLIPL